MKPETKSVALPERMRVLDEERREVEILVAAYNVVDEAGDMIVPGAAAASIAAFGPQGAGLVKFMVNHQILLGPVLEVREDERGIVLKGRVEDDPSLDVYWKHIKSGALSHGSIMFYQRQKERALHEGRPIRKLTQIELLEGGPVDFPANRQAAVLGWKSLDSLGLPERKGLWTLREAVEALMRIRDGQHILANLLKDGQSWALLTPEEIELAHQLIDLLSFQPPPKEGDVTPVQAFLEALTPKDAGAAEAAEDGDVKAGDPASEVERKGSAAAAAALQEYIKSLEALTGTN